MTSDKNIQLLEKSSLLYLNFLHLNSNKEGTNGYKILWGWARKSFTRSSYFNELLYPFIVLFIHFAIHYSFTHIHRIIFQIINLLFPSFVFSFYLSTIFSIHEFILQSFIYSFIHFISPSVLNVIIKTLFDSWFYISCIYLFHSPHLHIYSTN